MPRLNFTTADTIETSIAEGSTSIGRSQNNDIRLDDKSVSKRHALITVQEMKTGELRVQLADLHSTNGTFVNGKRISYHNLTDGDEVMIGTVKGTYSAAD